VTTLTTAGIRSRLARARGGASRRLHAAARPVVNLVPNPSFRAPFDRPYAAGGLYVHVHNSCEQAAVPGLPGVTGALVTGTSADTDTHIAPGGRNAAGRFRLGMRPGGRYTAGVSVYLPAPLTGSPSPHALSIVVGCLVGSTVNWSLARSLPARNEHGDHRISVTFTVPANATAAWIRLVSGMSAGNGVVYWHSFAVTETEWPVDFFDGGSPAGPLHTYEWLGEPDASPSRRVLRADLAGLDRREVAEEAVRLARAGATAEADVLLAVLGAGEKDAAYRVALARARLVGGDEAAARAVLGELVREGDPGGDAAYELGLLDLAAHRWPAAETHLRAAAEARPDVSERAYRLAYALDKLKQEADSKAASAAGLAVDGPLPFDGPAVLDMDVKCFGARREIGIFLAGHLDQLRVQARQRLAAAVDTAYDLPIFVYWGQGFAQAPPVVRACLAALRANNPGERVHELTDDTVPYYVDMPEDVVAKAGADKTAYSDLLRLALLEKFGGVWVDATCFVSEPLRPHVTRALDAGSVFAFHYTGPFISNWLLASRRGSYALHLWRAAAFLWWEKRGELIDYFQHHHMFEMLHHLDAEFRAEWDAGLRLSSGPPHALQTAMLSAYDRAEFAAILAGSFAHKLRYKYRPHEVRSESHLARFVRGDLPVTPRVPVQRTPPDDR
jgi:Capsular polysaccharide synthesis protein